MRTFFFALVILTSFACKSGTKPVLEKTIVTDKPVESQPPMYICFDINGSRQKGLHYLQLGDSLFKVIKLLSLSITDIDSSLTFGSEKVIERSGTYGSTEIYLEAHFNELKRMDSFKSIWLYKGDRSKQARQELFNVLQEYASTCLWEESVNLYKPKDTLVMSSSGGARVHFITDLSEKNWIVRYEAFWE